MKNIDECAEKWFSTLPSAKYAKPETKEAFLIAYKDGFKEALRWNIVGKDPLPESKEIVLIFFKDEEGIEHCHTGYIKNGFWFSNFDGELDDYCEVLAWQDYPARPTEEE